LEKNAGNSTIDNKLQIYWCASDERGFYGNQYVKTMKLTTLGKGITKFTGPIGWGLSGYDIYKGFQLDGGKFKTIGYNTYKATAGFVGGTVGCLASAKAGAVLGTEMGIWIEGVGMFPGSIIGGIIGGIYGSFKGSMKGKDMINKIYNR
jgi:hypothetical protein